MNFAYPMQKIQDWITQQWVILWGRKIIPEDYQWLMGPFGNLSSINEDFINQFAEKENLVIDTKPKGLIFSINQLNISDNELPRLSEKVIDFYENTADYDLSFSIQWNSFFKVFGILINKLFSHRINQLNIPTHNIQNPVFINSEIITLRDPVTHETKYTFWLRSIKTNGQSLYSGAYGICTLPSGITCIKAVFPLPNGNATVIMVPKIGINGELILDSSGKNFGDAGFYFLLKDSKGAYWSQYIRSFRDQLIISAENKQIIAIQTLTLWYQKVLKFNYKILLKK